MFVLMPVLRIIEIPLKHVSVRNITISSAKKDCAVLKQFV